jgi:hypothetical protein
LSSFALPDQVIILSDGVPTEGHYFDLEDIADEVRRLNTARTVRVDVVAFGDESEPDHLGEIARQNGGTLTILPESFDKEHRQEMKNMEKELERFLRTIREKNRDRGKDPGKTGAKRNANDPAGKRPPARADDQEGAPEKKKAGEKRKSGGAAGEKPSR